MQSHSQLKNYTRISELFSNNLTGQKRDLTEQKFIWLVILSVKIILKPALQLETENLAFKNLEG